ncbi:anti-sigma factor [Bacillus sp. 3255]|uniref:anti-sigma factor family protein n=1 Tax=Bacillus sp. 3255 TaxID=2817904 RepID=UPI0028637EB5|nr:anti-sigma factor [Bacillus sp. 3255]MDR6880049.1 hypothetical protein [Bacillus sp. 3255]
MICQEVMELMQRQLDGDLNSQEEDELHAHLEYCLDCAEMFERLQRLSDDLTQLPKVVPPYSLVDAILPQLAEIDRGAAASITDKAAVVTPDVRQNERGQTTKLPWTRRFGSQFSWKFAGGVVAAGLILGFFVFNMKQPVLDNADGLLPMSRQAEERSAASSELRSNLPDGSNMKKAETPNAGAAATEAPAADASAGGASGTDKQETHNSDSGSSGPQATTDANLEKPDAIKMSKSDDAKDASQVDPSTTAPERMKDAPADKVAKNTETAPTSPASGQGAPNKNMVASTPSSTPSPSLTPQPTPAAGTPERNQVAKKGADADQRGGVFSLTVPTHENMLKSASGTLSATVEDQHVVIRNSTTGELVFASKKAWQPEDQITLLEWSKDDKLFYQVQSGGSLHMMRIDVNLKTEETP